MDKRKRFAEWSRDRVASVALLAFVLGCGYFLQFTADSPAALTALTARSAH